jgi:hypothetical protein
MSKISRELDELQKGLIRAQMTDREKFIDDVSDFIVRLIVFLAVTTSVWAILHLIFVLPVTWLQVAGAFILFNLVRSLFR